MDTILITGGAGFVGRALAEQLLENYKVIVIDDLSSGYEKFLNKKVIFFKGSINDEMILNKAFDFKPSYIIHLAALFANQNSIDNPINDLKTNGFGFIKILEYCKKFNVKKVLYSSSSCVYGNKTIMNENDADLNPDTPYAITKLLGEHYAKFWSSHHGLDVVSVRLFNVYGPGDFPGVYRSVVPNFIKLALQGKSLTITGTGNETRDFCYIDDTVNGICKILFNKTTPGDTFNIATGKKTTILEIANIINKYCNNKSEILFDNLRDWDVVLHRQANIDKISSQLGFTPLIGIDLGLKKTCDWLKQNI